MTVPTKAVDRVLEVLRTHAPQRILANVVTEQIRSVLTTSADGEKTSNLRQLAATLRTLSTSLDDDVRAYERHLEALREDEERSRGPWVVRVARSLVTGEMASVDNLDETHSRTGQIGERKGERLHRWKRILDVAEAEGHEEARQIAHAARARLAAHVGLDWLADEETAMAEIGGASSWGEVARGARDLDRDNLIDAESAFMALFGKKIHNPEMFLGLALIAERRGQWTDAERFFTQASEACTQTPAPLRRLEAAAENIRPARSGHPAGAYLALAKQLEAREEEPEAICHVLDAASVAQSPAGAPWQREIERMHAAVLESKHDPSAGGALATAARAYERDREYDIASDLSQRAIAAGATGRVYWQLVERMRLADIGPQKAFDQIVASWERALVRELPTRDTAWAVLTRALASETYRGPSRSSELAATLLYGEWALMLGERDAQFWAFLARFYRTLNCEHTAWLAARRAFELSPASSLVLEENAAILGNVGALEESFEMLDRVPDDAGDPRWRRDVRGYLHLAKGNVVLALELFDQANAGWTTPLRAAALWRLGRRDEARVLYRSVLEDPSSSVLQRVQAAFWTVPGSEHGPFLALLRQPREEDDDLVDIHSMEALLSASTGDVDGANACWRRTLDELRVPRHITSLELELHAAAAILPSSLVENWLAQLSRRGAALRARFVLGDPQAARQECELLATRFETTKYRGFLIVRDLREAADHSELSAAARQISKLGVHGEQIRRSRLLELVSDGDDLLARDDLEGASRCYELAGVLGDASEIDVRRATIAALTHVPGHGSLHAARALRGDLSASSPSIQALCSRLSPVQRWRASLAFCRAAEASQDDVWNRLAHEFASHAKNNQPAIEATWSPPSAVRIEVPQGVFHELSNEHPLITKNLRDARAAIEREHQISVPWIVISETAQPTLRVVIDGVVAHRVEMARTDDEGESGAQVQRAIETAVPVHLPHWLDLQRLDDLILRWPADLRGELTASWRFSEPTRRARLLAVFQALARERIPSEALGLALRSAAPREINVYELVRAARHSQAKFICTTLLASRALRDLPTVHQEIFEGAITEHALAAGTYAIATSHRDVILQLHEHIDDKTAIRVRDPRVRFVVALVLAALGQFVPVLAEEEL